MRHKSTMYNGNVTDVSKKCEVCVLAFMAMHASVAVAQFLPLTLWFLKFHTNHSDSQSHAQAAGAFQQETVW